MKRELKGIAIERTRSRAIGFTHHPDEEGTERRSLRPRRCRSRASHTIPMKRELKGPAGEALSPISFASHTIPMKRELKERERASAVQRVDKLHTPSR